MLLRAHVFTTDFLPLVFRVRTRFSKLNSINGPFFSDRLIQSFIYGYFLRLSRINFDEDFFGLRVL